MSIIEQTSPLNLIGKLAVVTNASSLVGACICRTLLRHNCLVLGLDTGEIHPSLNARLGTHMQFLRLSSAIFDFEEKTNGQPGVAELVTMKIETGYGYGREVDYCIDIVGEHACVKKPAGGLEGSVRKMGLILSIQAKEEARKDMSEITRTLRDKAVRFNAVVAEATHVSASKSETDKSVFDHDAYEAVRSLRGAHDSTDEHVRARGIANLVLFLVSGDADSVDGMKIAVDGTCVPL